MPNVSPVFKARKGRSTPPQKGRRSLGRMRITRPPACQTATTARTETSSGFSQTPLKGGLQAKPTA